MWLCLRLLRLLSLIVGALLSPACLAGVPIAEDDGGGQSAIMPFEIGDTAMVVQGTSFASSVASNHVRVPTPKGATEGSLFIMVSSTNTRNVELYMSLCMYDCQDLLCLTLSFISHSFVFAQLIGDSGGTNGERAQYRENWTPLADIGGDDVLNVKVQYKIYGGGSDHFGIQGGVNQFVTMPSITNVDAANPIVDVVAERFVTNSSSWEVAAPSVNSVDGGAVLVLYLLDSDSSRGGEVVVSGVTSQDGFELLGSNIAMSGENMAVFISPSEEDGGCTDPVVAEFRSAEFGNEGDDVGDQAASGIVMAIALRPEDGPVSNLLIPCSKNALWNLTRTQEREGLAQIYKETGGPGWVRSGGWLEEGTDQCNFEGVDCNEFGLVTSLNLERNNLKGSLPRLDDKFRFLQQLNFGFNSALQGTFDDLGAHNLANITHINLSRTKLSGGLSQLPKTLQYLDCSDGFLGPEALNITQGGNSTLEVLDLAGNDFRAVNV